jgi:hypothetical protein
MFWANAPAEPCPKVSLRYGASNRGYVLIRLPPVQECLVAHAESRLGNREALDIADWISVVALSTLSGRSGASPHLKSRNDRPQRPGLAFAHFDFGISGIVHDEHERAACSRPDFFYPAQVHQGGAMGSKETELR